MNTQESPLLSLLSVLSTSIRTIESELGNANMPSFGFEPHWHPLDSPDAVPTPKLHEARRAAIAASNMIKALVQDVGTAMTEMSLKGLEQAAYTLTADIRLLDVYKTDEEKTNGLHIDEIVSRLPEDKKVNPQKLARCLRLLSTEHWWIEPTPDVFAPLRWALINTAGSPTWAWANPASHGVLVSTSAFVEQMTDPAEMNRDTVDAAPWVRAFNRAGTKRVNNWWDWLLTEPDKLARFAQSMEGCGYLNLASIKADYPWDSLPPDTTFVDVGSGRGSVALHVLRLIYNKNPTLKVVLQDRPQHLEEGRKYWSQEFPDALQDHRVKFEPHDFFEANPCKEPNTIYWFRFIMHDWSDEYAIKILKAIRVSCHPTSKVLLCDCLMREALPSKPQAHESYQDALDALDNNARYEPIGAPYPIPQNYGRASVVSYQYDILMYALLNGLERTAGNFDKIITASGFRLQHIYPTRGLSTILELTPAETWMAFK